MIECSLIDLIPCVGHTVGPLNWLLWSDHTWGEGGEWSPSSPLVTVVFYHVLEVSCYHSFRAVKSQLFLRLVTLGCFACKHLQVFRYSVQDVKFVRIDFKSALQSCLRIHLDCLTAVRSNLFGLQDCLKRCRGGHPGELIPFFLGFN
jgi:hypothetical protein